MLTPEDTLRLNVLISTCVAIRVDVYKLVVIGLTADKKEQTITLNPDIDSSKYIQAVQKTFSQSGIGQYGWLSIVLKALVTNGASEFKQSRIVIKNW